jgi:hypothetical protein
MSAMFLHNMRVIEEEINLNEYEQHNQNSNLSGKFKKYFFRIIMTYFINYVFHY